MKKVREKLKKVGVLFIAGLLCFNSFAAIVSDNDGSAFITKAEFDSLKNDFQAQIDSYNTSIDNKIDGAIAAYLAGIRVSKTETQNIFLYKQKVVSARNNVEINWEEGNMQFGGNLTVARNPGGTGQNYLTGSLFVQWPGVTATNFKEILVEGAFNNSYGIFKSFSYTKQKLTVTGVNQADSTGFGTDWSVAGGRVRLSPLSSWANVTDYGSDANKGTSLSSYSGSEYPDGIIRMNGQMHPSYNTGFYAFIPWSGSVWQREDVFSLIAYGRSEMPEVRIYTDQRKQKRIQYWTRHSRRSSDWQHLGSCCVWWNRNERTASDVSLMRSRLEDRTESADSEGT